MRGKFSKDLPQISWWNILMRKEILFVKLQIPLAHVSKRTGSASSPAGYERYASKKDSKGEYQYQISITEQKPEIDECNIIASFSVFCSNFTYKDACEDIRPSVPSVNSYIFSSFFWYISSVRYQKEISREKVVISAAFQLLSIVCPTITYHTLALSSSCYLWVSVANV